MVNDFFVGIIFDLVQVFVAMLLSVFAIYTGMKILDRLTVGIEEWEEIKKGNIAVGMLYASVIVALILMVSTSIQQTTLIIQPSNAPVISLVAFIISLLLYGINLILSILIIYLAFNVVDKLTVDIEEIKELKKGNVAVALILSVIIISVALVVRSPLSDMFHIGRFMSLFAM